MKKKIVRLMVVVTLILSMGLVGCGSKEISKSTGAEELNLFVWTEYVPQSVLDKFTEETGIKINVTTFSSNEDMLAKIKSETPGAYDIIQPSDYMVAQLISQDMVAELDKEALTNLSNIGTAYLNPSYDQDNTYSVPYQGGVAAIAVNTEKVDIEINSYEDLFNPSLANSIVVLDDFRAIIGMTARSMGYSMNETDLDRLEEIKNKLLTIKPNIKLYDSDSPKGQRW